MLVLETGLRLAGKTIGSHRNVLQCQPCEHPCAVTAKVENPRRVFGWYGGRSRLPLNILKTAVGGGAWLKVIRCRHNHLPFQDSKNQSPLGHTVRVNENVCGGGGVGGCFVNPKDPRIFSLQGPWGSPGTPTIT